MTIWNYDVRDFLLFVHRIIIYNPDDLLFKKFIPKLGLVHILEGSTFFEMIISRRLDLNGLSDSHSHGMQSSDAYKIVFICSSATLKSVQTDRNARATRDSTEGRMVNASRKSCATRSRHLNEC